MSPAYLGWGAGILAPADPPRVTDTVGAALAERDASLAAVQALIDATCARRAEALLVVGGAGIGKTSIVDVGREVARRSGLRVAAARGIEIEIERAVGYGVLRRLLEPLASALPADRRDGRRREPSEWYSHGMRATIDQAGRLVIPKALRDSLGLRPGVVEVVADGAGIRVEAISGESLAERDGRLVIPASGVELDDDAVRALRDADRR